MANPVTWFEITGKNGDKLREFYKNAFGWQMEVPPGMNYGMVSSPPSGNGARALLSQAALSTSAEA